MWNEGQTAAMTVCVGEWSRRARCSCVYIHRRQVTRSLVLVRQWTSRVARWHLLWSCSTAEQSTATTTCRRRHKLTTEATDTIMLRPADVSTVRSTRHWVVACRLRIHSTLTNSLTHSLLHSLLHDIYHGRISCMRHMDWKSSIARVTHYTNVRIPTSGQW